MTKRLFIILIAFYSTVLFGQTSDSSKTWRLGVIGTFDYAYNFHDKVLNAGISRRFTVGLSVTNKKRQFVGFVAVGAKGFKINLYSSTFRSSFINDVQENYVPINGTSEDSLVGATMNSSPGKKLWGTYSHFIHVGFILNTKMKPTINFYMGKEEFLLHGGFAKYEDPEHGDINYVGMLTKFYEFKIGCTIPFKKISTKPFSPCINIGYKWVDYGQLAFNSTPISAYTNGNLKDKYGRGGKITISVSFYIWSNWHI